MAVQKEKYVLDSNGKPAGVIIGLRAYRRMLRDLEELESIRAYDAAKKSNDEAVPLEQALEEIERQRQ
jgi:PHD/YefM family antitoxin component YafN of YafNO toxin-antitoxin module